MPLTHAAADGFADLSWRAVIDALSEVLRRSYGRYPERSVDQLGDYLSTITTVTRIDEDEFTQTQKEKVRLLDEYRDDIDALFEAAETLRQQAVEEWPALFLAELDDGLCGPMSGTTAMRTIGNGAVRFGTAGIWTMKG